MGKIIRAIAGNDSVRAFFIEGTDIVEDARKITGLNPVATAALGRLLCITSIMGYMLKSEKDIITARIDGDGPMKGLLATSNSSGNVRGCVYNNDFKGFARFDGKLDVGGAIGYGSLSIIKDLGLKEPYTSTLPLVTGEIAEDFTYYFANSEQTPTSVGAGVLIDKEDASVSVAGAFVIQLLPNADEADITLLEGNIAALASVTDCIAKGGIEALIEALMKNLNPQILDEAYVCYECDCSYKKFFDAILTLPLDDIKEMVKAPEDIEVVCNFCGKKREISKEEISNKLGLI